jgi:hypothetical protein
MLAFSLIPLQYKADRGGHEFDTANRIFYTTLFADDTDENFSFAYNIATGMAVTSARWREILTTPRHEHNESAQLLPVGIPLGQRT